MNQQRKILFVCSAIIAAIVLYYYNPFELYFQNDDFIHIPLSANGELLQHNTFRPICDLSIMLDYYLWGKNAYGYHLTNLILHIICTILVFLLSRDLFNKYAHAKDVRFAFITSLIFFLYPMHSEAVFWILGRSAILACIFFLLSIIFFLKREKKTSFFLSILFAFAAWLSYESSWVLPVVLLCISFVDIKTRASSLKKERHYIFVIILSFCVYMIARNYYIHEVIGQYEAAGFLNFNIQLLSQNFLKLMMRSWLPPFIDSSWLIALFLILVGALLFLYYNIKTGAARAFFLILVALWLISLLLYASLGIDTKGTEGERFLYLPSIPVCMILGFLSNHFFEKKLQKVILASLGIFYLGILYINTTNYRLAGTIVKTTLAEVKKLKTGQSLYVQRLPQAAHGALIFRDGFKEGVYWITSPQEPHEIIICSQMQENELLQNSYKVQYADSITIDHCNGAKPETQSNVVLFSYTDSVLYISR